MTIRDWLKDQGIVGTGEPLAQVARRIDGGEDGLFAVREFLDGVGLVEATGGDVWALISDRPGALSDLKIAALLGALAEHIALRHDLPTPKWAQEADRFLTTWWFPSSVRGLDALAIVQSPVAFRRRGIFILENALDRC